MTPFFKERYTKMDDISLIVIRFFFTQTNLVFKSKPMFIYIADNFFHSFINFWLLIFYGFWSSSSASTSFLQKPVKLWWGSMFFFNFQLKNFPYYVFFFMKPFLLLTAKITLYQFSVTSTSRPKTVHSAWWTQLLVSDHGLN